MKTIIILTPKGGSGKTTTALGLAVEIERACDGPVCLIETDPQGSLGRWYRERKKETPCVVDLPFLSIPVGLDHLRAEGMAYCIIDTGAGQLDEVTKLVQLSDLVIIPVKPSILDLWAGGPTLDVIKAQEKKFVFVLNEVRARTNATARTAAYLSGYGQVAQSFIHTRTIYAEALETGQTAAELRPKGPAATEIAALWIGIKSCFQDVRKSSTGVLKSARVRNGMTVIDGGVGDPSLLMSGEKVIMKSGNNDGNERNQQYA